MKRSYRLARIVRRYYSGEVDSKIQVVREIPSSSNLSIDRKLAALNQFDPDAIIISVPFLPVSYIGRNPYPQFFIDRTSSYNPNNLIEKLATPITEMPLLDHHQEMTFEESIFQNFCATADIYNVERPLNIQIRRIMGSIKSYADLDLEYENSIQSRTSGNGHGLIWKVFKNEREGLADYITTTTAQKYVEAGKKVYVIEPSSKSIASETEAIQNTNAADAINLLKCDPGLNFSSPIFPVVLRAMIESEAGDYYGNDIRGFTNSEESAEFYNRYLGEVIPLTFSLYESARKFYSDGLSKLSAILPEHREQYLLPRVQGLTESDRRQRIYMLLHCIEKRAYQRQRITECNDEDIAEYQEELFKIEYPPTIVEQYKKAKPTSFFERLMMGQ